MENKDIIIQQVFNHSKETVWKALTEVDQMKLWFFDNIPSFEARVGFQTAFNINAPSRDFMHLWKVTEVEENKKLVVSWTYADIPGEAFVSYLITETTNGCHLKLVNQGLENFPQDIPEFARESCIAGWTYFIKDKLLNYLNDTF